MRRASERGGGKLKLAFWLLVLVAVIYTAAKTVPHFVSNYELEQYMQEEARFAVAQRKSDEEVRNLILGKMGDLGIEAGRENVTVRSTSRGITISASYTVVVDLLGYKLHLDFNPSADSRAL